MPGNKEDCGTKHLRLAAVIITIVGAMTGVSGLLVGRMLWAHDARLREVEQSDSAVGERLRGIDKTLIRIEAGVECLTTKVDKINERDDKSQ